MVNYYDQNYEKKIVSWNDDVKLDGCEMDVLLGRLHL